MRWQIAQFIFCDQQQTLSRDDNVQQLEPMVVELLSYFCRNRDQIISRDQLIENVWLGRIVSDNAVNRVITKLRKVFEDDAKQPRFIATFPKKGYKFIAQVVEITNQPASLDNTNVSVAADILAKQVIVQKMATSASAKEKESQREQVTTSIFNSKFLILALALIIILLVMQQLMVPGEEDRQVMTNVKALTRGAGSESQPQISPDGTRMTYTEVRAGKMRLMLKSFADERVIEISHGENSNIWVGSGSWSFDGTLLVYLVTTNQSCQYFIRTIKALELGEAKLIHNCPAASYGKIAFTHDNDRLVYTESTGRNSPFSLFEINLKTNKKRRLSQPELVLGGNSQFDMHPFDNKILISSPDLQQWEGFYVLDLETDELRILFKQDAYICCGIWNHQGDRVILMGEHPAKQLISYDLTGGSRQVIYSGSQQLRSPQRHSNGQDYLFVAGYVNQDIHLFNITSQQSHVIADASVDERLATFAHHSNEIAYLSVSSGSEEIWLTDVQ